MPFIKKHNNARQVWKDWDNKANKQGLLHTVYFSNGNEYTGEWQNNKKHGKGIHVWKNKSVYNGDWKNDLRDGFGTLSIKNANTDDVLKRYSGEWMTNKKHGYGICNFGNNSFYEGEWMCNKRHGWGKMVYSDSSIYEGEWKYGKRSGQGILKYANGNRYEGEWQNNMKNGFGKFFYYEKGQLYEGVWVNDVAKCGEIVEFEKEFVTSLTIQAIPEIGLLDPLGVLKSAISELFPGDEDQQLFN